MQQNKTHNYRVDAVFSEGKWKEDVVIFVDSEGVVNRIEHTSENEDFEKLGGYLIPGFRNDHSHAFQYAMAGLAEHHPKGKSHDDFWSWRTLMYDIALKLSPDDIEVIATLLYSLMLSKGYTHVVEFHYLHHDPNGRRFENIAETGTRLIQAAKNAGISITLVPIFYQKGGFGKDPEPHQRRFISNNVEDYLDLVVSSQAACDNYEFSDLGIGIHSLRAVDKNSFEQLIEKRNPNVPFHLHISEQLKEVEECEAFYGHRPVEWLYKNTEVDAQFNLVHATHLTSYEVELIAKSKANVVLCPTTEGNLGDGIFPLISYMDQGGLWSLGTDSHVSLDPFEEIRILDYGQRLTSHRRDTFGCDEDRDSGVNILNCLSRGQYNNSINVGQKLNAVWVSSDPFLIESTPIKNLASTLIYTDHSVISGVFVNGKLRTRDDLHEFEQNTNLKNTFRKIRNK